MTESTSNYCRVDRILRSGPISLHSLCDRLGLKSMILLSPVSLNSSIFASHFTIQKYWTLHIFSSFFPNDMTNLELKIIISAGKNIYCMLAFQAFRMGKTICKRIQMIQGHRASTFPIFVNLIPTGGAAAPPNPQAETPMCKTNLR